MNQKSYQNTLLTIIGTAIAIVAAFYFHRSVMLPFDKVPGVSLIFLPVFLKIVLVVVFEWEAVFGLILGFFVVTNIARPVDILVVDCLLFCVGPMLALLVTRAIFKLPENLSGLTLYHIIMLSTLSAGFQGLNFVYMGSNFATDGFIGDLLGALISLVASSATMRFFEFLHKKKNRS